MPYIITDEDGNTALHALIKNLSPFQSVKNYIDAKDSDIIAQEATMLNNAGEMPYNFIKTYPLELQDAFRDLLLPFMIKASSLTAITQLISPGDIQSEFASTASDELLKLLMISTEIINRTRTALTLSVTHPELNSMTALDKYDVHSKLSHAQSIRYDFVRKAKPSSDEKLALIASRILPYKVGNCGEYAQTALYYSVEYNIIRSVELVSFTDKTGDHVFLILNRDRSSPINEISRWGQEAVLLDAWAGNTYPACQLPEKLKDYRCILIPAGYQHSPFVNILVPYAPHFHQLEVLSSFIKPMRRATASSTHLANSRVSLFTTFDRSEAKHQAQQSIEQDCHASRGCSP